MSKVEKKHVSQSASLTVPFQKEEELGYRIMVIFETLQRELDNRYEDRKLTDTQARVIDFIYVSGGSVMQRDVQSFLHVSHPTVVGLIRRMCEKGFITIQQSSQDMRANVISLSDAGMAEYKRVQDCRAELEKVMTKSLSADQVDELNNLLDQVLVSLNAE